MPRQRYRGHSGGERHLASGYGQRCIATIPNFDWSKHQWAFGVDAEKCIGCLRCVEACKLENNVLPDAHHFRTWVERYVTLEGEGKARIDSQADPVNIEASGAEGHYSSLIATRMRRSEKPFSFLSSDSTLGWSRSADK